MLAEDVRLDFVARMERSGAADVGGYFDHYARRTDLLFELGAVDDRLAIIALERHSAQPSYCMLVGFRPTAFRQSATTVMHHMCWRRHASPANPAEKTSPRVLVRSASIPVAINRIAHHIAKTSAFMLQ